MHKNVNANKNRNNHNQNMESLSPSRTKQDLKPSQLFSNQPNATKSSNHNSSSSAYYATGHAKENAMNRSILSN